MSPTSAPVPTDHHDSNDYGQEAPPSRGPYNYDDLELSINCEGRSLSDPLDTSGPANSEGNDAGDRWCPKCFTGFRSTEAFLEHCRTSVLHITCRYCDWKSFGNTAAITTLYVHIARVLLFGKPQLLATKIISSIISCAASAF